MKLLILTLFLTSSLSAQLSREDFSNLFNDYARFINEKNLDNLLSFYDESYVGYYPGEPDQSFDGIKEQYQKIFQNKNLTATVACEVLESGYSESFSYVQIVFSWVFKSTFSSQPMNAADKGLLILKRDNSGKWKIIRSSLMSSQTGSRHTNP
jgi:ketosteroid isomerase-like protein